MLTRDPEDSALLCEFVVIVCGSFVTSCRNKNVITVYLSVSALYERADSSSSARDVCLTKCLLH